MAFTSPVSPVVGQPPLWMTSETWFLDPGPSSRDVVTDGLARHDQWIIVCWGRIETGKPHIFGIWESNLGMVSGKLLNCPLKNPKSIDRFDETESSKYLHMLN